jgi:hypothetical protein
VHNEQDAVVNPTLRNYRILTHGHLFRRHDDTIAPVGAKSQDEYGINSLVPASSRSSTCVGVSVTARSTAISPSTR